MLLQHSYCLKDVLQLEKHTYVDELSIIINNNTPKHVRSFGVGHSQDLALYPCSVILRSNVSDRVGHESQLLQFVKNSYYCDSSIVL